MAQSTLQVPTLQKPLPKQKEAKTADEIKTGGITRKKFLVLNKERVYKLF
jgi:hypothetical protein